MIDYAQQEPSQHASFWLILRTVKKEEIGFSHISETVQDSPKISTPLSSAFLELLKNGMSMPYTSKTEF
jgi:hypothetical protein